LNKETYIDSVEQKAIETNGISEDLRNWLEWVRKKAQWYDPFIECDDEEVSRDTATIQMGRSHNLVSSCGGIPRYDELASHQYLSKKGCSNNNQVKHASGTSIVLRRNSCWV